MAIHQALNQKSLAWQTNSTRCGNPKSSRVPTERDYTRSAFDYRLGGIDQRLHKRLSLAHHNYRPSRARRFSSMLVNDRNEQSCLDLSRKIRRLR